MIDCLGILREIPWLSMLWEVIIWTFLSGVVGLLIGLGIFLLLRKYKIYNYSTSRAHGCITAIICMWMLISFTILSALFGLSEGLLRGVELGIRESPIGKKWLPAASGYGADLMFIIDQTLNSRDEPAKQLDISKFLDSLKYLKQDVAENLTIMLINKALNDHPEWKGTLSEKLIRWILPWLAEEVFGQKLKEAYEQYGVDRFVAGTRDQFKELSGKVVDHKAISEFLSEKIIIPGMLFYLKRWMREVQLVIAIVILCATAIPAGMTLLTRYVLYLRARKALAKPTENPKENNK